MKHHWFSWTTLVVSLWFGGVQDAKGGDNDYNLLNRDGSYQFGYDTPDSYHYADANRNNVVRGEFGARNPGTGRIDSTLYTAGPRGFRPRGRHVHRKYDLGQAGPRPVGSPDDPNFDPLEDPSYSFGFRTRTYTRNETANRLGNVVGRYTYRDDVGDSHHVEYVAGSRTGFHVRTPYPDSNPRAYGPLYFNGRGRPLPRGRTSIQRGLDGSYRFVSAGPDQRRTEISDASGHVRGSYTYLDDKGVQHSVHYIAGPETGYRVLKNVKGPHLPTIFPFGGPGIVPPNFYDYLGKDDFFDTAATGSIQPGGNKGKPPKPDVPLFDNGIDVSKEDFDRFSGEAGDGLPGIPRPGGEGAVPDGGGARPGGGGEPRPGGGGGSRPPTGGSGLPGAGGERPGGGGLPPGPGRPRPGGGGFRPGGKPGFGGGSAVGQRPSAPDYFGPTYGGTSSDSFDDDLFGESDDKPAGGGGREDGSYKPSGEDGSYRPGQKEEDAGEGGTGEGSFGSSTTTTGKPSYGSRPTAGSTDGIFGGGPGGEGHGEEDSGEIGGGFPGVRPGGAPGRPVPGGRPGGRPGGARPGGYRPGQARPGGSRPIGPRPVGPRPGGQRPVGPRPGGQRPGGQRPPTRPGIGPDIEDEGDDTDDSDLGIFGSETSNIRPSRPTIQIGITEEGDKTTGNRGKCPRCNPTLVRNLGDTVFSVPPGASVRAHVQAIDLLPVVPDVPSPSDQFKADSEIKTEQLNVASSNSIVKKEKQADAEATTEVDAITNTTPPTSTQETTTLPSTTTSKSA